MELIDEHVPRRKPFQPKKKKNEWITRATVKKIRDRCKASKRYRNLPSIYNYDEFKRLRNEVTASID